MTVRELDPFVHGDRFAYSTHQLRCLQCGGDAIKRVKHVDQTNFDDASIDDCGLCVHPLHRRTTDNVASRQLVFSINHMHRRERRRTLIASLHVRVA